MFGSPDDGIGIAGSAGTISSINTNTSSDDDLLDIRHGGTTSENVTMPKNNNSTLENSIGSGPSNSSSGGGINSSFDTLSGGGLVMPSLEDFPEAGMGQYDDFHTIGKQTFPFGPLFYYAVIYTVNLSL